jgi:hypothetical protein
VVAGTTSAFGQTYNWGSPVFSDLRDSKGNLLDNSYVFELGAFMSGFVPDADNQGEWEINWQTFDRAAFNPAASYFTGSAAMLPDGTSDSPYMTTGAVSFEGLDAYLWVQDGSDLASSDELFLGRVGSWVFNSADPACCGNSLPTEWSLADFSSETPIFGSQTGNDGAGGFTVSGGFMLQTFSIPEPSSAVLVLVGALIWVRRHRRAPW